MLAFVVKKVCQFIVLRLLIMTCSFTFGYTFFFGINFYKIKEKVNSLVICKPSLYVF